MINFTVYVNDPEENLTSPVVYAKTFPIKLEFRFWPYNKPPFFLNSTSLYSFKMELGHQVSMESGEASSDTVLILV